MDKTWITCYRVSIEYRIGVVELLKFSILNAEN